MTEHALHPIAAAAVEAVEERAHAILSASGSHIWLHCPPAARFQEEFPDQETEYSREGTWAHSVAAHRLAVHLGQPTEFEDEKQIPEYDKFFNPINDEAINAYVRRCLATIAAVRRECPDAIVLLEQRLDFSDWVPQGFGTGDLVIIADKRCIVRDLKFGKGVRVDAEENTQLYLYAAGAIAAYRGVYDFDEVVVEIDQPRLNHVDGGDTVIQVRDILHWLGSYVQPRAKLAWDGEGEFAPGDHCRFCRAAPVCRARAEAAADMADAEFDAELTGNAKTPEKRLTPEEIAKFLPRLKAFVSWANALEKYAYQQAVDNGVKWPGLKLVAGRSNRVISDPQGLAEVLMMEGYEEALVYAPPRPRELLGLGELEKLTGKKKFAELSDGYVTKPPGKPTLVPEDDPRDEWKKSDADSDFAE